MATSAPNVRELPSPPTDTISSVSFSPYSSTRLIVPSWDGNIHLYDTYGSDGTGSKLAQIFHDTPVLSACYGDRDTEIFSGGLNFTVNTLDPENNTATAIGAHNDAVSAVCYNTSTRQLITGSWDKSLHTYDPRTSSLTGEYIQPEKIFSMSTVDHTLVISMANRGISIYDLRNMSEPSQIRESSLKFQNRTVVCMPNGQGYATSSIEGRVAVEFLDPGEESQARKFVFKCHRQVEGGVDVVYPVNALAFHPVYGTFASGGGDGVVSLWDGAAKIRLRQYQKLGASIAGLSYNNEGRMLAIGTSAGFEGGQTDGECPPESVRVIIREMPEGEGKGKVQEKRQ